jgi:hypothetical protein
MMKIKKRYHGWWVDGRRHGPWRVTKDTVVTYRMGKEIRYRSEREGTAYNYMSVRGINVAHGCFRTSYGRMRMIFAQTIHQGIEYDK